MLIDCLLCNKLFWFNGGWCASPQILRGLCSRRETNRWVNVTMCEFSGRRKRCDGVTRSECVWGERVGYCGHSSERTAGISLNLDRRADRPEARSLVVWCVLSPTGAVEGCSLFSCWVLSDSGNPMNRSPPASSVLGISQAGILEWIAISFSRGSSQSRDWTHISCMADRFFTTEPSGKPTEYISEMELIFLFVSSLVPPANCGQILLP